MLNNLRNEVNSISTAGGGSKPQCSQLKKYKNILQVEIIENGMRYTSYENRKWKVKTSKRIQKNII